MTELKIRKLDSQIIDALKLQAQNEGVSLEQKLRDTLTKEALRPQQELIKRLRKLRSKIEAKHGTLPDSAAYIRAMRDGLEA